LHEGPGQPGLSSIGTVVALGRRFFLTAAAAAVLASVASAATSPAQTLASALDAGRSQRSVHYVSGGNTGSVRVTMVGDAAVDRGIQRITFRKGGRTGHVTVLVVANTAYVRGDAYTLQNYMGFKAPDAAEYAGKWILIPHDAGGFATVAAGVRLASTIDEARLPAPLVSVPATTVNGERVLGVASSRRVSGHTTTATLYIRAKGAPLPVVEVARQGSNSFKVTFSGWNERVRVVAPSHVVHLANTA
jgi:hypothetical protein